MGKSIKFTFEGKEYELEFNRKAVEMLEGRGFSIDNLALTPATTIPLLFHGAFYMHHKGITMENTNKILATLKDTSKLISKLAEMYSEPINALIDDTDEKNLEWEANW